MASKSESIFGARVANAEKISAALKTFTGFVAPTPETSVVNYDALIASLKSKNADIATYKTNYSAAVETRQKIFFKNKDSVLKLLSPIASALRAKLGKAAKPVADVMAMVVKIRGEKKAKPKDPKAEDAQAKVQKETISQSEKSYGSITQTFNDIVTSITTLGSDYAPVNNAIKLQALNTKLAAITTANANAASTFTLLKAGYMVRSNVYDDLSERTQRIKEQVKSQYGTSSAEYILIKGLKV